MREEKKSTQKALIYPKSDRHKAKSVSQVRFIKQAKNRKSL